MLMPALGDASSPQELTGRRQSELSAFVATKALTLSLRLLASSLT